ncbi:MAG: PAS domain S-box protein [Bacteroidota bacterium]
MTSTLQRTILLIEDNPLDVILIREMLKQITWANYRLIASETLKDGCRQLKENTVDIVLLDLNLPDSTGKPTFDTLLNFTGNIPIVLVTGMQDIELALSIIKCGAQDFLTKNDLNYTLLHKAIEYAIERKQTEGKLAQASTNWTKTFNSIQDGIILLDKEQNIVETNKTFLELIGKTNHQVKGHHCWPFVHGTHCAIENCPFVRARTSHQRETMDLKIGESDYEVMVDPILDASGDLVGAVHIVSDITIRKQAEAALHASEEKYRSIFENVQDVFYQTNLEGIVMEISPSIKYFSEFNPEEIIGRHVSELYQNPDDREILLQAILENGELKDYELKLKAKNGTIKHVSINARLIYDSHGHLHHINGAIRDISERKEIEIIEKKKIEDLLHFGRLAVSRENRMIDLKREINDLLEELNRAVKYEIFE